MSCPIRKGNYYDDIDDVLYLDKKDQREGFLTLKETYLNRASETKEALFNDIISAIKDQGIYGDSSLVLDDETIKSILYTDSKTKNNISDIPTTDTMQKIDAPENVKKIDKNFLSKAYGNQPDIKLFVEQKANVNLSNAMFIDRVKGEIVSPYNLDNKVVEYQQKLFDQIFEYLNQSGYSNNTDIQSLKQLYTKVNGKYKYTRNLEKIQQYLDKLKPESISQDMMAKMFKEKDNPSLEGLRFNAYTANILLNNFDSLVKNWNKAIIINDFGKMKGSDKYQISSESISRNKTFRTGDNIDVDKETSDIIKGFITTTPYYTYGSSQPISDTYLNTNQFNLAITAVKSLLSNNNLLLKSVMLKDVDPKIAHEFLMKPLSYLINKLPYNPQEYSRTLYTILSNEEFFNQINDKLSNGLNDVKDVIYSIYKGFFDNDKSIFAINEQNRNIPYYSHMTQYLNTLYKVNMYKYGVDSDGHIVPRTMIDDVIENKVWDIKKTIKAVNAKSLIHNSYKEDYIDRFNMQVDKNDVLSFTIGNDSDKTKRTITIGKDLVGSFQFYGLNSVPGQVTNNNNINYDSVLQDIDRVLGLNLTSDKEFVKILSKILSPLSTNPTTTVINGLLPIMAEVLYNTYVSNVLIDQDAKGYSQVNKAAQYYEDKRKPKYNKDLYEIDTVGNKYYSTLKLIAKATAIKNGIIESSQVKDGEGNSLSKYGMFRLLETYPTQFVEQNETKESATNELEIIKNKNLLVQVTTCKEIKTLGGYKQMKDMNEDEFITSSFMYDFIAGMQPKNEFNETPIGSNNVAFVIAALADKTTIGKEIINIDQTYDLGPEMGGVVSYKNMTSNQLKYVINKQLGSTYRKIIQNVDSDFNKLRNWAIAKNKWVQDSQGFIPLSLFNATGELVPDNFARLNLLKGNQAYTFLSNLINEYNHDYIYRAVEGGKTNYQDPIEAIDQIHFANNKGTLSFNEELKTQYTRFVKNGSGIFWRAQSINLLDSLLRNNVKFDTTDKSPEQEYLKSKSVGWINDLGYLILAKYTDSRGQVHNINQQSDIDSILQQEDPTVASELFQMGPSIQLNPMLQKYNLMDFLFTQSYMLSTVGTFTSHPNKSKSKDYLAGEASRYNAQNKRNSDYTASITPFQMGLLNGVSTKARVAVIADIHCKQTNVNGNIGDIKPFDGATFVSALQNHWENNSLGAERAGTDKKQYIHAYNERFACGRNDKTAGFSITNERMRNSEFYRGLHQQLSGEIYRNEDGTPLFHDITRDYKGNKINFNTTYKEWNPETKSYDYYQIYDISPANKDEKGNPKIDNIYNVKAYKLDENNDVVEDKDGNFVEKETPVEINSNYKLWQALGGYNTVEFDENLQRFNKGSESSIIQVANAAALVGIVKEGINPEDVRTSYDLFQLMKASEIVYGITEGAMKMAPANINSASKYFPSGGPLNTIIMDLHSAGIQLDKEHIADDSEISIMTQVLNACAARGYTIDQATELFEAVHNLNDFMISDFVNVFKNRFNAESDSDKVKALEDVQTVVTENIAQYLTDTRDEDSLLADLTKEIREKIKTKEGLLYKDIVNKIPYSSQEIANKIISILGSTITNKAVKLKFNGALCVLSPSHSIMKLFNGKLLSNTTPGELEAAQELVNLKPLYDASNKENSNLADISIGKTYNVKYNNVSEPTKYFVETIKERTKLIQDIMRGDISQVVENVQEGRDLGAYDIKFEDVNGERYSLYDLRSINDLFRFGDLIKDYNGTQVGITEKIKDIINRNGLSIKSDDLANPETLKDIEQGLRQLVQNDLSALSQEGKENKVIINRFSKTDDEEMVSTDITVTINKNKIDVIPYEIIMPKIFKTIFQLDSDVDINEIINDNTYFTQKLLNNLSNTIDNQNNFDAALQKFDQSTIYLLDRKNLINSQDLHKVEMFTLYKNGKKYRTDSNDNIIQRLDENDELYKDEKGNEIIVTDNLGLHMKSNSYNMVTLSTNINNQTFTSIYNAISNEKTKNKSAKDYLDFLTSTGVEYTLQGKFSGNSIQNEDVKNALKVQREFQKKVSTLQTELIKTKGNKESLFRTDDLMLNLIQARGRELHTSFMKSLDLVASRTPSQSMQSFMAMKVVGFNDSDVNTAYVSTSQIWFQGSDFDVDAVSLLCYEFGKNGKLVQWSNYFKYGSKELLNESMKLPFPTFKEMTVQEITVSPDEFEEFWPQLDKYFDPIKGCFVRKEDGTIIINTSNFDKFKTFVNFIRTYNRGGLKVPESDSQEQKYTTKDISQLLAVINQHNTFLNDQNDNYTQDAMKNFIVSRIYSISSNPINQQESQTPVDLATGELKREADKSDEAESILNRAAPGNVMNKFAAIVANQTGKTGISSTAVGMKSSFAIQHHYNKVLNYGTPKQQQRLLYNVQFIIDGDKKTYRMMPNVNVMTNNDILEEVQNELLKLSETTDINIDNSAFMSLATDNAKELKLAKLNAGQKTIDMYVFGVTIGMKIPDIAKIMMSPTANVVMKLFNGNIFTNKEENFDIFSVFRYLANGPQISKGAIRLINSNLFNNENKFLDVDKLLDAYTYNDLVKLQQAQSSIKDKREIQKVLDFIKVRHNVNNTQLSNLQVLAVGAKEYKILGTLLGANQGTKNKIDELQNYVETFENANDTIKKLQDQLTTGFRIVRGQRVSEPFRVSLSQFMQDNEYREKVINEYEHTKLAFNIYDIIASNPNYMSYINNNTILFESARSIQAKTRFIDNISKNYFKEFGVRDPKKRTKATRGLQYFHEHAVFQKFATLSNIVIELPKGVDYYDNDLVLHTTTGAGTSIVLGTDAGDASFKILMERNIIPNLKKGLLSYDSKNSNIVLQSNEFIKNLQPTIITNNQSNTTTLGMFLGINMLPNSTYEDDKLKLMTQNFDKLASYRYTTSGTTDAKRDSNTYGLQDLFFYYTQIVYGGKRNQIALTPIFKNQVNVSNSSINKYYKFINQFDLKSDLVEDEDYDQDDIAQTIVDFDSPLSNSNYIKYTKEDTPRVYEKIKKENSDGQSQEDDEYADIVESEGYDEGYDDNYGDYADYVDYEDYGDQEEQKISPMDQALNANYKPMNNQIINPNDLNFAFSINNNLKKKTSFKQKVLSDNGTEVVVTTTLDPKAKKVTLSYSVNNTTKTTEIELKDFGLDLSATDVIEKSGQEVKNLVSKVLNTIVDQDINCKFGF